MIRYSLSTFRALVSRRYDHNIVGLRYIIIIMDIVIVYIEDTVWRARGLSSLNSNQIRNARNAPTCLGAKRHKAGRGTDQFHDANFAMPKLRGLVVAEKSNVTRLCYVKRMECGSMLSIAVLARQFLLI